MKRANTKTTADFAKYLNNFLTIYLPGRNLSENTIVSYGDTFLLLMDYFELKCSINREQLCVNNITVDAVNSFLKWLHDERGNSPSTCNNRLAAIKTFARFVSTKSPSFLYTAQMIRDIDAKKTPKAQIQHLTKDQTKNLIEAPDKNTPQGRRDLTMLCLLYDSAARVQELCDLTVGSVRTQNPATVTLTGKGMKTRTVPIMSGTAKLIDSYLAENKLNYREKLEYPLFFNHRHEKLTRAGVTYILKKYFILAKQDDPTMPEKISPHVLRHSKAMHMLQADTHLIYIRDFLGHESVQTTEVYARADPETKRKNVERVQLEIETDLPDWRMNKKLMEFLEEFGKTAE